MRQILTSVFTFRLEHCKHRPCVFLSHRKGQRKQQPEHIPRCCCSSKPSLGSQRANPHGPGWNWVICKVPFQLKPLCDPQGPAPTQQGTAHVGVGDWFDYGFRGGQTDQQTLTLLTAVAKQTKEISLAIEVK